MNATQADKLHAALLALEAALGEPLAPYQRELITKLLASANRPPRVITWPRRIGQSTLRAIMEQELIGANK